MDRGLGVDVFEGDRQIILINNLCWDFPANNLAENCLCAWTHADLLLILLNDSKYFNVLVAAYALTSIPK